MEFKDRPGYVTLATKGTADSMEVACEHGITVYINRRPSMKLICTPQHLNELIIGRLYTENLIDGIEDVLKLDICDRGTVACVFRLNGTANPR